MTTLLLIRHGQSIANLEKRFAGQWNAELTETGIKQAKLTAQYIKENYNVSKVYASDLSRAFETGKCVSDILGIEIIPNKNLREICAGNWESMTFDDIRAKYAEDFSVWTNDMGHSRCSGGESVAELAKRVISALTEIAQENDGKTVAIATHATPIRVTQSMVQTGSLDQILSIPWATNASVSELEYNDGKWAFKKISIDSHLSELVTTLPANV